VKRGFIQRVTFEKMCMSVKNSCSLRVVFLLSLHKFSPLAYWLI